MDDEFEEEIDTKTKRLPKVAKVGKYCSYLCFPAVLTWKTIIYIMKIFIKLFLSIYI